VAAQVHIIDRDDRINGPMSATAVTIDVRT
jgi:hypothetical protein